MMRDFFWGVLFIEIFLVGNNIFCVGLGIWK